MTFAIFMMAFVAFVPIGLFGAYLPRVRALPLFSRIGVAYLCGAVLVTVESLLLSMSGIEWRPATIVAIAVVVNGPAIWFLSRVRHQSDEPVVPMTIPVAVSIVIVAASIHLVLMLGTSRATSIDFTYFWGVKAVHFAEAHGIDADLLGWQWFSHAVPDYPPLVPVTQAFGVLLAGRMPWVGAPLTSALWLGAALPVVVGLLGTRLPSRDAWNVGAFWYTAMALSIAFSYSGANAEVPLLAYETVGALGLYLTAEERGWWPFAGLMLAGATVTKVESIVVVVGLAAGLALRDRRLRPVRELVLRLTFVGTGPLLGLALWFGFQRSEGLAVGYRPHGVLQTLYWEHLDTVLRAFPSNLAAGSWGLSWIIPLTIIVVAFPPSPLRRLHYPMLAAVVALFAFFLFDYLHDPVDPWERIGWTLPRISQPALSMLILTAGLMSFGRSSEPSMSSVGPPEGPKAN